MKTRIGIVGGGQLGRMLSFAAKKMGFTVIVLDPTPHSPAGQVCDEQIIADYKDETAIRKLASKVDFLTFEIELANSNVLHELEKQGISVNPSPKTLEVIRDKFAQKKFLKNSSIPIPEFVQVESVEDIIRVEEFFGYPMMLKARFDAYDGRGNYLIETQDDIEKACNALKGRELYLEKHVPFIKELSIIVARALDGAVVTYPVTESVHKNSILHITYAPAIVDSAVAEKAKKVAHSTMKHLNGAGVFGIEMFLTPEGAVLVNEIAPRVHNTGHYTIESCITSQFEQHIRAVTGLPLGETKMMVPAAVMMNILGERDGTVELEGLDKALKIPDVSVHIYGKMEVRGARKMGHITAIGKDTDEAYRKAVKAREYISL